MSTFRVDDLSIKLARRDCWAIVWRGGIIIGMLSLVTTRLMTRPNHPMNWAALEQLETDTAGTLVAYGRRTGRCACCGRLLATPDSVEQGIHTRCAKRYAATNDKVSA